MQLFKTCQVSGRNNRLSRYSGGLVTLLWLLNGCSPAELPPMKVCQSVTRALLGFALPSAETMAISEQEIRGERIVVHLKFARPADDYPVNAVCVFAVDKYAEIQTPPPYSKVPTRVAINNQQVTEADLVQAIEKAALN